VLTKPEGREIHDAYSGGGAISSQQHLHAQRISARDYGMEGLAYE